jgi:hypothetical protein
MLRVTVLPFRIRCFALLMLCNTAACGQRTTVDSAASAAGSASAQAMSEDSISARQFVQAFYNTYLAAARTSTAGPTFWRMLNSDALDTKLAAALREDSLSSDLGAGGSREGLNFDPFLASQDPCPRYEVVAAQSSGEGFHVKLSPVCLNAEWQTQGPTVAVGKRGARWRIVNIFYERTDLLAVLCENGRSDKTAGRPPVACQQ